MTYVGFAQSLFWTRAEDDSVGRSTTTSPTEVLHISGSKSYVNILTVALNDETRCVGVELYDM